MTKDAIIVITGAAGFIGSCLTGYLNARGFKNLVLVDDFSHTEKEPNLADKVFDQKIDRDVFFEWLQNKPGVDFVFHLGARTDTTEFDYTVHERLNVAYSKKIWEWCSEMQIPLVYASSAATYGAGEHGYKDDEAIIDELKPLNPYGISKNEFDKWVLHQVGTGQKIPPAWAGLKFFNVYGPNEYHKGRMASVIFHAFNQVKQNGFVKLFRSHKPGFSDGEQLRDFVYVKDIIHICYWFLHCWQKDETSFISGIYNAGTGKARSFNDLVKSTFAALDKEPLIEYIDMPNDIRDTYQYFTEAEIDKLHHAGYTQPFYSLEKGIDDYVRHYLSGKKYL